MHGSRWLLAAACLGLAYWGVAVSGPPTVGLWQDDAVYLATARSLAEGSGYRHLEIPGEPLQTKYPIGLPALLSLGFAISPDYPANLPILLAPTALLAGGFVVLSALYLLHVLGESRRWALTIGALAALSPEIVSLVRFSMSDLPFAFWSVAALLCLDLAHPPDGNPGTRRLRLLLAGLLIGAAVLTRSFGLTLAVAAPATLVARRRPADAVLLLASTALVLLPWWLWQSAAAASNGALQTSPLSAYDLSYGAWLGADPGSLLRVMRQNLLRAVFGLGFFQLTLPADWVIGALRGGFGRVFALHAICYAAAGLVLVGFIESLRRRLQTLHVYALLYGAAMLAWPFEPYRFLVCWTPFLLAFLVGGVRVVFERIARPSSDGVAGRWGSAPAVALCSVLALGFLSDDARIVGSTADRYYLLRAHQDRSEHAELVDWLRDHTAPEDIIASSDTGDLFLATGRQLRDTSPGVDPISIFYGPDRRWREFYALPAASETRRMVELSSPHLQKLFGSGEVAFYVEHGGDRSTRAMQDLRRSHPHWFEKALETPKASYRVYRIRTAERESEATSSP